MLRADAELISRAVYIGLIYPTAGCLLPHYVGSRYIRETKDHPHRHADALSPRPDLLAMPQAEDRSPP